MKDGFICTAAGTPKIKVADCRYNAEQIFTMMREAERQGVKLLVLPELCLTGYTCADLFLQDTLLDGAGEGLRTILEATKNLDVLTAIGLPVRNKWDNKLYNCAAVIQRGEILRLIPKTYIDLHANHQARQGIALQDHAVGEVDILLAGQGHQGVHALPGGEPALLIELSVVGDIGLGDQTQDLSSLYDGGAIIPWPGRGRR